VSDHDADAEEDEQGRASLYVPARPPIQSLYEPQRNKRESDEPEADDDR